MQQHVYALRGHAYPPPVLCAFLCHSRTSVPSATVLYLHSSVVFGIPSVFAHVYPDQLSFWREQPTLPGCLHPIIKALWPMQVLEKVSTTLLEWSGSGEQSWKLISLRGQNRPFCRACGDSSPPVASLRAFYRLHGAVLNLVCCSQYSARETLYTKAQVSLLYVQMHVMDGACAETCSRRIGGQQCVAECEWQGFPSSYHVSEQAPPFYSVRRCLSSNWKYVSPSLS